MEGGEETLVGVGRCTKKGRPPVNWGVIRPAKAVGQWSLIEGTRGNGIELAP